MNAIGLHEAKANELVLKLNSLLASYQVFYMNVRGLHWNIKGNRFFELHAKFENIYDDLAEKIDEIAERVLTLGGTPLHTFAQYLEKSKVKVLENVTDGMQGVTSVLETYKLLLAEQRVVLELAGDNADYGTNALMNDYISEQEKLVWMYSSFLNK